jgi:hypothetical protein
MAANEIILLPSIMETLANRAWAKIEAEMLTNNDGNALYMYFVHGTPRNIAERLDARSKAPDYKNKRFPMVALVHNYEETFDSSMYYNDTKCTVWLMNIGRKTNHYEDRYTENFVKFLYPLWQAFINELERSGSFIINQSEGVNHSKIDRPNWGLLAAYGNSAYTNGENIDGIELKLNLRLDYLNCLKLQKQNQTITN